jgi:cytochrome P450
MQDPANAIAAVTHADPYPWYGRMREASPLLFDQGLQLWVAYGADVVQEAFAQPLLRVRPLAEPLPAALQATPVGDVFARLVRMNDGDFHRAHKPAVHASAQRWDASAASAAALTAAQELGGTLDANALLSAVPVRAMARLLGVPAALLEQTTQWVLQFTQAIAPGADGGAIAAGSDAALELMAQGEAQGLDPVRAANRIALMQQAVDATAGLLGNAALALRAEPSLHAHALPGVVAEVARWDAPVQNTRRFAAQAVVLAGLQIEAGQGVLLVLAAANRDPALNPEPQRLWPGRPMRRGLGFGAGAHACPGEALAIAIASAALPPLLPHLGRHAGYRPLANARIPVFID